MTNTPDTEKYRVPFYALFPFLIIAFGLAWGMLALFLFLSEPMTRFFGQVTGNHPLFFLAVYAPAIAASTFAALNDGICQPSY